MLLTASESRQIRLTFAAIADATTLVYHHPVTRMIARYTHHAIMLTLAALWFTGVGCYHLGRFTRVQFERFMAWQAEYVESCQFVTAYAPIAALPAAKVRRHNCTVAIANDILITPAPATAPKRRGRPKGSKTQKAA